MCYSNRETSNRENKYPAGSLKDLAVYLKYLAECQVKRSFHNVLFSNDSTMAGNEILKCGFT